MQDTPPTIYCMIVVDVLRLVIVTREMKLLIAVNRLKKKAPLFKLSRNRVLWIAPSHHECIGSEVWQVHPMLRDFQFVPTKESVLFCGSRMMYQA